MRRRATRRVPSRDRSRLRRPPVALLVAGLAAGTVAAGHGQGAEAPPPELTAATLPARSLERSLAAGGALLEGHRLRGLRPGVVRELLAGEPGGLLPLSAMALPLGGSEPGRVVLLVEIDGASFVEHNRSEVARVEAYVYALGAGRRVAGHLAVAFAVDLPAVGEGVWQSGLKLFSGLELPSGGYTLRVLVRNHDSGAQGLAEIAVEVPPADEPAVLPPLARASPGRDPWVPVVDGAAAVLAGYPWRLEGEPFVPETRPVVASGRQAELVVFGAAAGSAGGRADWLDGEQEVASDTPAEIAAVDPGGGSGPTALAVRVAVPELPPGEYRLRLELDGAGGASTLPPAPVLVAAGDGRSSELLWTDLRWLIGERGSGPELPAAAQRLPAEPESRRAGRGVRQLAARYRAIVGLTLDDPEAAQVRLLDLESEVVGRGRREALRRLVQAELLVAEELAARRPEALVAVAVLHSEMVRIYRGRRAFSLVFHARAMVERLAERYAALGGEPAVVARLLAVEGGELQRANLPAGSRRLFARALEHDAATPAALLGLAASLEKFGQYAEAVEYLEQLVAQLPELGEGRLRLAVNLARTGRLGRSREQLERLVEAGGKAWVRVVAVEELARSRLATGDPEGAVELLEPAVGSLPEWPELRFLLALAYERSGRAASAHHQLAAVSPRRPGEPPSARRLYDEWPAELRGELRRELLVAAERSGPALAEALAGSEGSGP